MLNQKHLDKNSKTTAFLGPGLLLVVAFVLSACGLASEQEMVAVESSITLQGEPSAQTGEQGIESASIQEDITETAKTTQVSNPEIAEDMHVLFEEMTLVQLLWEQGYDTKTLCAGNDLNNIQPQVEGPIILIPNTGDLSVDGSNVSIKLSPEGVITFIPRTQGQRIRVPMDVNDKVEGEEVLSLSLDEAWQLVAASKLTWTAKDHGPYGYGQGLAGHIAECDPLFIKEEDFK